MAGGRSRRAPSRLASGLFLLGCLGVLGATFTAGVVAGRLWPRSPATAVAPATKETKTARPAEPTPALTFYQELTAPLTAPPPVKPVKPAKQPAVAPVPVPDAAPPPASTLGAFTIQVGAYKSREPAESLRARLAAAGHDAYVAEVDSAASARYRVRIGSYGTREAARLAADKILAGERTLSAFVTAR